MPSISFILPWPPTINTYWRRRGSNYFIGQQGIKYRHLAVFECFKYKKLFSDSDKLHLDIIAYPPDRRRRDIDNILKCLLDSLQHAEVYKDDYQIDKIMIQRMSEIRNEVHITLSVIND